VVQSPFTYCFAVSFSGFDKICRLFFLLRTRSVLSPNFSLTPPMCTPPSHRFSLASLSVIQARFSWSASAPFFSPQRFPGFTPAPSCPFFLVFSSNPGRRKKNLSPPSPPLFFWQISLILADATPLPVSLFRVIA